MEIIELQHVRFLQVLGPIASLLQLVGPIFVTIWAMRAGRSRNQVLLAAAVGGMPAGFLLAIITFNMGAGLTGLPYIATSAVIGAVIGGAGLLVRALGTRRYLRP